MLAIRHEMWVGVRVEHTENSFVATASSFREDNPVSIGNLKIITCCLIMLVVVFIGPMHADAHA